MHGNMELKLTISDIFSEPYTWYYKYQMNPTKLEYDPSQDRIVNKYKFGSTIYLAVRYNF
jgi:hypothetical protein